MSKDKTNDTAIATANATEEDRTIATRSPEQQQMHIAKSNQEWLEEALSGEIDLNSLSEQKRLEVMREIMLREAELETISLPMVNSRDIVGQPLTIHDAVFKTIPVTEKIDGVLTKIDKKCVNFLCENASDESLYYGDDPNNPRELVRGELFTCLKGSNPFNDAYVMRFQGLRGVALMPLRGYRFEIEPKYSVANNPAIVLRKIKPSSTAKSVN